jgi:hypothetical protein
LVATVVVDFLSHDIFVVLAERCLFRGAERIRETHDKDDNDYDPGGGSDNEEGVRGRPGTCSPRDPCSSCRLATAFALRREKRTKASDSGGPAQPSKKERRRQWPAIASKERRRRRG